MNSSHVKRNKSFPVGTPDDSAGDRNKHSYDGRLSTIVRIRSKHLTCCNTHTHKLTSGTSVRFDVIAEQYPEGPTEIAEYDGRHGELLFQQFHSVAHLSQHVSHVGPFADSVEELDQQAVTKREKCRRTIGQQSG